ncbi:adenosylcobinamide-GDP ribazoletransferase [Paenibacillus sp. LHD-117]|uniref:adenosylcobinamide-GDP ribazoletransferase n=1 Tax=Paenibacillus sp. LHD-117 TaxID=3071412 RepID=UPI0027E10BE5|nr:adenosylcobinamide-GDP ribazoletransferase [Paenibacillus sp. LHD-117]MDQ6421602.1 adenosylcobinamide-GDP ribazoletransferase [Paenibacillus sp. LHD-117]
MARHVIKDQALAAVAAVQFLTRLPMPIEVPFERRMLARSVVYFPVAGLLIGVIAGGAAWLLGYVLPPWPAAVLTLAIWIGLSGGLHIDGWMDAADGVLSNRPRERMLDIMKDSRVGAMGVLAAVLLLLLKASLLAEVIGDESATGGWAFLLIVMASCFGRASMAIAIAGWPPARKDEGLGSMFNDVNKFQAATSAVLALIISLATLLINDMNLVYSVSISLIGLLLMSSTVAMLGTWFCRKLGGLTGDTYGAINEAVEALLLVAAVIAIHMWS